MTDIVRPSARRGVPLWGARCLSVVAVVLAAWWPLHDWQEWDSREACRDQLHARGYLTAFDTVPDQRSLDRCDELTVGQYESALTWIAWGWYDYSDADRPEWMH